MKNKRLEIVTCRLAGGGGRGGTGPSAPPPSPLDRACKGLSNIIWDWPRRCRGSNSEKVKIALSLELSGIFLINFCVNIDINKI